MLTPLRLLIATLVLASVQSGCRSPKRLSSVSEDDLEDRPVGDNLSQKGQVMVVGHMKPQPLWMSGLLWHGMTKLEQSSVAAIDSAERDIKVLRDGNGLLDSIKCTLVDDDYVYCTF